MSYPTQLYAWLNYWREMYFRPNVSRRTYELSDYYLRIIRKNIPDYDLEDITLPDIQKFLNDLKDAGYARDTIKKLSSYVVRALDKAVHHNLITTNPAQGRVLPKAKKKKVHALTQEQQRVLEIFCGSVLYGEFMEFMLLTGLRVGELCKLKHCHYNAINGEIFIADSKTAAGIRYIPLIQRAKSILEAQPISEKDNYIFHNKHGNPITYSSMKKCYEKLRKLTGFEEFTNHVCRHSFATRLMEKGAHPKSTAALLGHAKADFCLNIYTDIEKSKMTQDIFLLESSPIPNLDTQITEESCIKYLQQLAQKNNGQLPFNIMQLISCRDSA